MQPPTDEKSHLSLLSQAMHYGMVLCATAVVFLPLFLVKIGQPRVPQTHSRAAVQLPLVCLPDASDPNLSPDVANVYAWIALRDPFLLLKPDNPNGFRPNEPHLLPRTFHSLPQVRPGRLTWNQNLPDSGAPPVFDDQPLRRVIRAQRDPRLTIDMPKAPEYPPR